MDFTLDAEQTALRDAARSIATDHVPTRSGDVPVGPAAHDAKLWSALAELGALGLPFAEEAGGLGASAIEASIVAGELGRAGVVAAYPETMLAGSLLAAAGQDELLESVVAAQSLVIPALAEPGRAWGATPSATATSNGDDVTLVGAKTAVPYADSLTHALVTATDEDGIGIYLIEAPTVDDTGMLGLSETPATRLLSGAEAEAALSAGLGLMTAVLAAEAVGAMESALTMTTEYLRSRKQFGVPLMTFQTLTQRAADMYVSLELARSMSLYAAMVAADRPGDVETFARVKVVVGQSGRHIAQEAIQLHGGIGMTAEYAVGHLSTRLTAIEHTAGDTRFHLARLGARVGDHDQIDVLS